MDNLFEILNTYSLFLLICKLFGTILSKLIRNHIMMNKDIN